MYSKITFLSLIIFSCWNCHNSENPKTATTKKEAIVKLIEKQETTSFFDTENHYNNYKNLKHRITKLKSIVILYFPSLLKKDKTEFFNL